MNIVIISSGLVNIKTFLLEQIKFFINQSNARITIITNYTSQKEIPEELKKLNVKIINIPLVRKPNIFLDVLALIKLILVLNKKEYNIVITITPKAGFVGAIASFIKRIPLRMHIFTGQVWVNKKGFLRFSLKTIDKIIYKLSTKVLIDSKSQKEFLIREKIINNNDSVVILNGSICGVDIHKFKPNFDQRKKIRQAANIKDDEIVLLFIGRLNKDKGVYDLLKSFSSLSKKFNNLKLLMVGPDEERFYYFVKNNYPDLSNKILIENFTFDIHKYYIGSDIFVMPSYREGFGLASIEASSCELPVIASNIYGLLDSVKNGINGFLHEPGDVKKIEFLVTKLINNKNYISELGKNGRKLVTQKFSQENVINFFCSYVNTAYKKLTYENFLICGTSAHSMYNFRGDLILDIKKKNFNVIGLGDRLNKKDLKEIDKLEINYYSYSIDNASINPFRDLLSFIKLSFFYYKYNPKYTMCYTIKAVIIFGFLKKIFKKKNKSYALITGIGNVFVSKNELLKKFVKVFYRLSLKSYNKIFFQNHDDNLFFINQKLISRNKSTNIFRGSGVNIEKFYTDIYPVKITFSIASRMIENKGINEFCEVAKRISEKFSNVEFLICGDFTKSPYSLQKDKTLNLFKKCNVKYYGWIDDMKTFYEKTSVYVLPSVREGTPRTVLEAMAMKRPIITNDVPGCRDTVLSGYNGYLTKLGDIDDLENKLKLFISNPNLIKEMGNNSRTKVTKIYDVKKINREMINIMTGE